MTVRAPGSRIVMSMTASPAMMEWSLRAGRRARALMSRYPGHEWNVRVTECMQWVCQRCGIAVHWNSLAGCWEDAGRGAPLATCGLVIAGQVHES